MSWLQGAGGFIGGALARQLLDEGHFVVAGYHDNVPRLQSHPRLRIAHIDVSDKETLVDVMQSATHVAHLAALRGKRRARQQDYYRVNVQGTRNVFEAARDAGIERMVFASTVGVHGFVDGQQIDENSPCNPNTGYRLSKLNAEQALAHLVRTNAAPGIVTVRLSTAVGAGATAWRPFIAGVKSGGLRLIGDGSNYIDLVAVEDLATGLIQCLFTPAIDGRTFALGSAQQSTLRQFADWVADALDAPRIRSGPPRWPYRLMMLNAQRFNLRFGSINDWIHAREALVADKRVSSERARGEIGYMPTHDIWRAVNDMVKWELARQ